MTVLNGLRKYTIILGLISRTPNILNGLAISTDKEKFFYNSKAESGKVVSYSAWYVSVLESIGKM